MKRLTAWLCAATLVTSVAAAAPGGMGTLATSMPTNSTRVPVGYQQVAREYGVPADLLYAIARAESQAKFSGRPWPWTLNVQGTGYFFVSRAAASRALRAYIAAGIRNVDIGVMQINWRWHSTRLLTPDLALDPYFNLRAAAGHLRELYLRSGDWTTAAGLYHAPNNEARAAAYAERVQEHLAAL